MGMQEQYENQDLTSDLKQQNHGINEEDVINIVYQKEIRNNIAKRDTYQ